MKNLAPWVSWARRWPRSHNMLTVVPPSHYHIFFHYNSNNAAYLCLLYTRIYTLLLNSASWHSNTIQVYTATECIYNTVIIINNILCALCERCVYMFKLYVRSYVLCIVIAREWMKYIVHRICKCCVYTNKIKQLPANQFRISLSLAVHIFIHSLHTCAHMRFAR